MRDDDDHDARTIHCSNLAQDRITEELLYELFLQVGPLERVSIPKDNGKNRSYAFVTYKYRASVPYAMDVFSGTKLFNRDLRLNNRNVNKGNNSNDQSRGYAAPEQNNFSTPRPDNPYGNAALRGNNQLATPTPRADNPFANAALRGNPQLSTPSFDLMNNLMPKPSQSQSRFTPSAELSFETLLQYSVQMLSEGNGLGSNNMGSSNNDASKHQSKIMHRHENRPHNQNTQYNRDKDQRNDRRRDRSHSRDRGRNDWVRNRDSNRSDRRDRDKKGDNRRRGDRF